MISTYLISIVSLYSVTPKPRGTSSILANYDFLMFRAILRPTNNMRLGDMSTVKERHYPVWENPYGNLQVAEDQKFQVRIGLALLE
jgi:hypothetical protein